MSSALIEALLGAFTPISLFLVFVGTFLGILCGSIPGLTATMAIALVLPITFNMEPALGLAMLMGVYIGAVFGGSISAILINVPGTPASMVTSLDGYPMAKQGKAGSALGISILSSFWGGIISAVALILIAPILGGFALRFGPPEYFAIGVFALSLIAGIASKDLIKGLVAGAIGVSLTLIGMDPITGTARYTFGIINLYGGLNLIPILIGLFGFREVLIQFNEPRLKVGIIEQLTKILPTWKVFKKLIPTIFRGGIIGTYIGILPGAGGPIASFMAYDIEKKLNNKKDTFGSGEPRGVAASESANNASTGGALIPLLTLGIPGDGATAVLIGAFMMHNIFPGPNLFVEEATLVNSIYINYILANVMMLILALTFARVFMKALKIPVNIIIPIIALLCIIGSYAVKNSIFDIGVMIVTGFLGYLIYVRGFPIIAVVLGVILGPLIEANLRASLLLENSWGIFFTRPISLTIFIITILSLLWPQINKRVVSKLVKTN